MHRAASSFIAPSAFAPPGRWLADLRRIWARWTLSAEERHLADVTDFADLEQRLRRLERGRGDRFGPLQEWRP